MGIFQKINKTVILENMSPFLRFLFYIYITRKNSSKKIQYKNIWSKMTWYCLLSMAYMYSYFYNNFWSVTVDSILLNYNVNDTRIY